MKTVMPPFLHVVGCAVAVNAFTFWVLGGGAFGWEVLLWEGALAFALSRAIRITFRDRF